MSRKFTDFAFTNSVKAAQERYGGRATGERLERSDDARDELTADEAWFIGQRDGFYMATVGENGWPYVQFRGGPPGFLKVLDSKTLAFADFRGNRQYISTGNIGHNGRVAAILMDYANRRRLKIWAYAGTVDAADAPDLMPLLITPGYPGHIERAVVLKVEAFDWNCPQHVTPRFTAAEVEQAIAPLRARIAALESQLAAQGSTDAAEFTSA